MMAFGRTTGFLVMGLLLLASVAVEAQNAKPNVPAPAIADGSYIWQRLNVNSSSEISDLLKQQFDLSRRTGTFAGYRLQLYFGSGVQARARAERVRAEFNALHPDTKIYLIFKSPDFIVRAGDFRTKSDALKVLKSLNAGFSNAFIVSDEVVFPGPAVQGEIK
jgi:SPOR domain